MNNSYDEFRNKYKVNTDNRRKIKNKPSKAKFNVRVAAGLAATLLAVGGLAACKEQDKTKDFSKSSPTTYTIELNQENLETSVIKAEQDFLKRYLEGYNKKYGTDYKTYQAQLLTNSIKEGIVFEVDGKLVTPGNNPALVKQQLSEYGKVTTVDGHDKVMQILINTDEDTKVFTYDAKTLETMYSGTELKDIESEIPSLEELGISKDIAENMAELSLAKGNESEHSIKQRLDKYNKSTQLEDRGYEIID